MRIVSSIFIHTCFSYKPMELLAGCSANVCLRSRCYECDAELLLVWEELRNFRCSPSEG